MRFARHARVIHGRHEDQKRREREYDGDARTLFRDRFFRDFGSALPAFLSSFADLRHHRVLGLRKRRPPRGVRPRSFRDRARLRVHGAGCAARAWLPALDAHYRLASTVRSPIASASNNASAPLAPLRVPIPRFSLFGFDLGFKEPREGFAIRCRFKGYLQERAASHPIPIVSAGRVRLFFRSRNRRRTRSSP